MTQGYIEIDTQQELNAPTSIYNRAANWTLSGLDDERSYKLSNQDQKRILGFVVGRGRVLCDWSEGKVYNVVSACFGCDTTYKNCFDLKTGEKIY